MQPHAEMVHWFFGAGILFVGLCLLAEAIVGTEVWRMRPWRAYLWPGLAFALGVAALAGDGAVHELGDPHVRARLVGRGADARRRRRARARPRPAPLAAGGGSPGRSHSLVSGTAFIVHEQNSWFFARSAFLHHLLGWTFIAWRVFPLALIWRPRSAVLRSRLRADDRARLGDALLRPRRRAGLRAPVAARGGAAPMRRVRSSSLLVALALPAAASAHAHARVDRRRASAPSCTGARRRFGCTSTRPSRCCPARCACSNGVGKNFAGPAASRGNRRRRTRAPASRAARTPCAGVAISADSHVVSGVWTFGVARARAVGDRGVRRRRADGAASTSCAGSGSSGLRSRSARSACA